MVWKTVRDYSNFNKDRFVTLLQNIEWNSFNDSLNPNDQWIFLKNEILQILSVMCPYKRVYTMKHAPLWITPEIYRLIRERKRLMKLYRATGCYDILKLVYEIRNKVNACVDKAKGDFIQKKLRQNARNP